MDKLTSEIKYRESILNLVNSNSGIKAVNLVIKVMGDINPHSFDAEIYFFELCELIKEGEITVFEYILPQMTYKVKSMYFPKGTIFNVPKDT